MIHWYAVPLGALLALALLLHMIASDRNMPYKGILFMVTLGLGGVAVVAIWLACFFLSLITQ